MMPRDVALRVYMDHAKFYDKLQQRSAPRHQENGCTAIYLRFITKQAPTGHRNGLFTETLLAVCKNVFVAIITNFDESIVKLMPPTQSPKYFKVGRTNEQFEDQKTVYGVIGMKILLVHGVGHQERP